MDILVKDDVTVVHLLGVSFVTETLQQRRKTKRGMEGDHSVSAVNRKGLEGVLMEQQKTGKQLFSSLSSLP
jgi:hypothetical protein